MTKRMCSIDGCERPHAARGWCLVHYQRWRTNGDPLKLRRPPAPPEGFKRCSGCKEVKSVDAFGVDNTLSDKRTSACLECRRPTIRRSVKKWRDLNPDAHRVRARDWYQKTGYRNVIARTYGITVEEYDQLIARYGGLCAICKQPERAPAQNGRGAKRIGIDHDHTTGKVRGLLCKACNVGLGHFNEDPALLRAAINYLEEQHVSV